MKTRMMLAMTMVLVWFCCTGTAAIAKSDNARNGFHGVILMTPGDKEQRDVLLERPVSLSSIQPVDTFVLLALGTEEQPAGVLNFTIKSKTELDFGAIMTFGIVGFGLSLEGTPLFVYETINTPYDLAASVEINSRFGFFTLGAFVQKASPYSGVEFPAEFVVGFELAAQE